MDLYLCLYLYPYLCVCVKEKEKGGEGRPAGDLADGPCAGAPSAWPGCFQLCLASCTELGDWPEAKDLLGSSPSMCPALALTVAFTIPQ